LPGAIPNFSFAVPFSVPPIVRRQQDDPKFCLPCFADFSFKGFDDCLPLARRILQNKRLQIHTVKDQFQLFPGCIVVPVHYENPPLTLRWRRGWGGGNTFR